MIAIIFGFLPLNISSCRNVSTLLKCKTPVNGSLKLLETQRIVHLIVILFTKLNYKFRSVILIMSLLFLVTKGYNFKNIYVCINARVCQTVFE